MKPKTRRVDLEFQLDFCKAERSADRTGMMDQREGDKESEKENLFREMNAQFQAQIDAFECATEDLITEIETQVGCQKTVHNHKEGPKLVVHNQLHENQRKLDNLMIRQQCVAPKSSSFS